MKKLTINNWVLLSVTIVGKWIANFRWWWGLRLTAKGNKDFIEIYASRESVCDAGPRTWLSSYSKTYVTCEIMLSHAWIRSTTYTRSFPDHSEKSASAIMIRILRRFPGVLNKAVQPILDATFLSKSIAALISSNSYCTRGSLLCRVQVLPILDCIWYTYAFPLAW